MELMTKPPDMSLKTLYIPTAWIPMIDEARGDTEFSDFVRELIRRKIGADKIERRRGRPKKPEN